MVLTITYLKPRPPIASAALRDEMKPEPLLAELNRMRKDLGEDPTDIEWLTLQHAFIFISYQHKEFEKYVAEASERGEFKEYEESDQI